MMTSLTVNASISDDMRANIIQRLRGIEIDHDVRILFAVESGSRAWGFPSPDSDYDVRFVYARRLDDYLTLSPIRDVIELPIEGDYDINGWDIKKALSLLIKPNPVLLEWLSSPVRYIWDDNICQSLTAFSTQVFHRPACFHHYYNLGKNTWQSAVATQEAVKLKRYFYILRPVMVLRWLFIQPDIIPPMNFQALMAGADLPPALTDELNGLIALKAKTKELGMGPRNPRLDNFITDEFDKAAARMKRLGPSNHNLSGEANELFRRLVKTKAI